MIHKYIYSEEDMETIQKYKYRDTTSGIEVRVRNRFRLFVPMNSRSALIWEAHKERHGGVNDTMDRLKDIYYWQKMQEQISIYISSCVCSLKKTYKRPKQKHIGEIKVSAPRQLLAVDIYMYDGQRYLTCLDMYSKMPFAMKIANKTREAVAIALKNVLSITGKVSGILSDKGAEFSGIEELVGDDDMKHWVTSSFHPETNGALESFHKSLGDVSRIHSLNSDQAIVYCRTKTMRKLFYSRGYDQEIIIHTWQKTDDDNNIILQYNVGDLVLRHKHRRARTKAEDVYKGPMKITKKINNRTYKIFDGKTVLYGTHR